jgi:hypothetical protein
MRWPISLLGRPGVKRVCQTEGGHRAKSPGSPGTFPELVGAGRRMRRNGGCSARHQRLPRYMSSSSRYFTNSLSVSVNFVILCSRPAVTHQNQLPRSGRSHAANAFSPGFLTRPGAEPGLRWVSHGDLIAMSFSGILRLRARTRRCRAEETDSVPPGDRGGEARDSPPADSRAVNGRLTERPRHSAFLRTDRRPSPPRGGRQLSRVACRWRARCPVPPEATRWPPPDPPRPAGSWP